MVEIHFEPVAIESPALERLVTELRGVYSNGGALLGCFVASGRDTSDWFMRVQTTEAAEMIELFLTSPGVSMALPDLQTEKGIRLPEIHMVGPLAFGGELGDALLYGGMYTGFPGSYQQAREIGQAASDAIFRDRWQDVYVLRMQRGWCWWFSDILWDHTWIVVDRVALRVWLLCATDTD
jgi:hypothetical protein